MSHENSETYERDGEWVNVYGKGKPLAGQPLPPTQIFERWSYPSLGEAESAATLRSFLHGLSGGSHKLPAGPNPSLLDLLK